MADSSLRGLPTALLVITAIAGSPLRAQPPRQLDPAGWGGDHVGQPLPEFTSGDECLFCHRMDVGANWAANRHGQTIRVADPQSAGLAAIARTPPLMSMAAEIEFVLGASHRQRFLKRAAGYGQLDLLSVEWIPPWHGAEGKLTAADRPHWDAHKFGSTCAGCHSTGVDSGKQAFAAMSLDCFVCHGEVAQKHTTQGALVVLSPHRRDPPPVVVSVCAQCHIRTGMSRSSGLPYPNNFVAGDNLFRDFRVDLSDSALQRLNPADRHVQENVRDVVLFGREETTCLSCHDVHKQSSQKHRRVAANNICLSCHGTGSKKDRVPYEVHSAICGY